MARLRWSVAHRYLTQATVIFGSVDGSRSAWSSKGQKRPSVRAKETEYRSKRDLIQRQKRPNVKGPNTGKNETYYQRALAGSACHPVTKETQCKGKRDLMYRQKRPNIDSKETYYQGIPGAVRRISNRQQRPNIEAKETYYRGIPGRRACRGVIW